MLYVAMFVNKKKIMAINCFYLIYMVTYQTSTKNKTNECKTIARGCQISAITWKIRWYPRILSTI